MFGLEPSTAFYFSACRGNGKPFFFFWRQKRRSWKRPTPPAIGWGHPGRISLWAIPMRMAKGYTGREDLRKPSGYRCPCRRAAALHPPFPWLGRREAPQAWAEPEGRGSPRPSLAERREAERARRSTDRRASGGTCPLRVSLRSIFCVGG